MVDEVEIPVLELYAVLKALDDFLNDADKGISLKKYGLTTNLDPWEEATNTPYITYFWAGCEFDETEACTATLDILVMESAEKSEGAMHTVTNIVVDLWRLLRAASRIGVGAKDSNGKAVRVGKIRPLRCRIGPYKAEQGRYHAATVTVEISLVLRSI